MRCARTSWCTATHTHPSLALTREILLIFSNRTPTPNPLQDWLELLAAELVHRQPGVSAPNQLRPLLLGCRADWAAAAARRGAGAAEAEADASSGLLKFLWELLQVGGGQGRGGEGAHRLLCNAPTER